MAAALATSPGCAPPSTHAMSFPRSASGMTRASSICGQPLLAVSGGIGGMNLLAMAGLMSDAYFMASP